MSEEQPDRFFDLAMMKIAEQASDAELTELDGLLAADASLRDEYDRLAAESQLLKEMIPLAEATQSAEGEFPEYARANLQMEVREALGRPEEEETKTQGFWEWGLGLAAACVVVLLVVLNSGKGTDPNSPGPVVKKPPATTPPTKNAAPIIQIAMLDVAGATRGTGDTTGKTLQEAWPNHKVEGFSDPAKLTDEWLKAWPVDAKGPIVKIYYVVSSGELKVIGKTKQGTFEKSFEAEDLPAKLKQAQEYLEEQLSPGSGKQ